MKICRKCGESKALAEFHKRASAKDGYQNECSVCTNAKMREYIKQPSYQETKDRYAEANRETLRAKGRRYAELHKEEAKEYHKRYYETYKHKAREKSRAWRLNNPERYKANQTRYQQGKKDKLVKYRKDYHVKNGDKIRAKRLQWAKDNPDKQRAQGARYKAATLRATPGWADAALIQEFYTAADFLGMVTGEWYHVDHIVPLRSKLVCGLHSQHNLAVIPASENCSKSNRYWPDMP